MSKRAVHPEPPINPAANILNSKHRISYVSVLLSPRLSTLKWTFLLYQQVIISVAKKEAANEVECGGTPLAAKKRIRGNPPRGVINKIYADWQ